MFVLLGVYIYSHVYILLVKCMRLLMVMAENYALNNECAPNNEVLRISSYHLVICGKRVDASVSIREM